MSEILILDNEVNDAVQETDEHNAQERKKNLVERIDDYLMAQQSLKVKEKVMFFRLMSTMLNAWVSLTKWVAILEKQEKKKTLLKHILNSFLVDLKTWKWLSQCMEKYSGSFTNAELWMIESWEKTGQLNSSLKDLADQTEKLASINWKLKSALMYPAMIIVVVIWVIAVLMVMVVPKLLAIFEWSEDWLPASTKLLVSISDFFVNYWALMIIWVVWFVVFVNVWKKTPEWKYKFDMIMLKLPVFGQIIKKMILSKFSRVLAWMLKSWVSIVEALRITAEAVWNEVYRQRILLLRDDIKKWLKMYEWLENDPLFPDMVVSMIQIWEQTAKIDNVILKVADFYDEEVDNTIWIINKLLEPIIIVVLAVIVWFIAVAIMQPIMWLADQVATS